MILQAVSPILLPKINMSPEMANTMIESLAMLMEVAM